jgi:iron complex transport system substrate-binding protein
MSQAFEEKARAPRKRSLGPCLQAGVFRLSQQPRQNPPMPGGTSARGGADVTHPWIHRLGLTLLAAMLLAAAACGGSSTQNSTRTPAATSPTAAAPAFPLTVQRSDGKPLAIAAAPKHIVSLSPAATEIIYALGAQSSLVAVDKNADYPDDARNFAPKVDAYEPNIEAITGLAPDLVIVASDTGGIVAKLDELKIPVLFVDIDTSVKTVDDVMAQITLMGKITGTTDKASALVASLNARVKKVKDAVADVPATSSMKVYHELDSTFYSASDGTFVGDLYRLLKVRNVAGDGNGVAYPQLTQEAIIAANPSVIVLADEEFGVTVDSVKSRPGWSAIDAVKNDKIVALNASVISRPGPRIVDALETLAKAIYPERFK